MRYEAKHNYFKRLAQNLGNFINISWTLALRHQVWQCYKWLGTDQHDDHNIGPGMAASTSACSLWNFIINFHVFNNIIGEEVMTEDRPCELQSVEHCYRLESPLMQVFLGECDNDFLYTTLVLSRATMLIHT